MPQGVVGGLGTLRQGTSKVVRRLPPPARRLIAGLIIAALIMGAFAVIVLPLFHFGPTGPPTAEISGGVPERASLARATDMEVAIDNTGVASIGPVCVEAHFDAPVRVDEVTFQGLDRVPFRDGRACGGRLNSQETINVRISMAPQKLGAVRVRLAPAEGARRIGPILQGTMEVVA